VEQKNWLAVRRLVGYDRYSSRKAQRLLATNVLSDIQRQALTGCGKTLRSPFDGLRANGQVVDNINDFPFMLRLSKHEKHFFRNLLRLSSRSPNPSPANIV